MKLKYLKDLRELLDNLNITDSELADKFNKTQSSLSHKFAKDDMRVSEFTDIIELLGFQITIHPNPGTTVNGYKNGKEVCYDCIPIIHESGGNIYLSSMDFDSSWSCEELINVKDLDEFEILKEDGTSVRFQKRYKRLK